MSHNDPNKELNFDELHQAVSQIMDQKGKPQRSAATKVTPPNRPIAETPKQPLPKPEIKPIAAPKPADRGIPVAVRRSPAKLTPRPRGMAMDVVQTPKPTPPPPSAQASRTGATIQPSHLVQPEPSEPAAEPVAPQQNDISDDMLAGINMQSDAVPKPSPSNAPPLAPQPEPSFPDPLDVASDQQPEPPTSGDGSLLRDDDNASPAKNTWEMPDPLADEQAEQPEPQPEAPSIAQQPEPISTPFVKTNVIKRPLGAYAAVAPEPPKPAPKQELALPEPPEDEELLLPEGPSAPEPKPESTAPVEPTPETKPEHPAGPLDNLRQMSIPQQYKSADKEPNHAERPVFDTKNYHTPIKPPTAAPRAATSSGSRAGMWVSIILLVILIAAGVVAYFIATGAIDVTKILGK